MKISSKILSAGLSAVMLLTAVPLTAGAVSAADCKNILITSTVRTELVQLHLERLIQKLLMTFSMQKQMVIKSLLQRHLM